jgi:hypothetical protein
VHMNRGLTRIRLPNKIENTAAGRSLTRPYAAVAHP